MALLRIAALADLPPGKLIHVELGDRALAVCNCEGTVYAIDGVCPHAGGPLGCGTLNGRSVTCPWHMWGFDCVTGESSVSIHYKLDTYPVTIENGEIWVDA